VLRCARKIHHEVQRIIDQSENAAHVRIGDGCAVVLQEHVVFAQR
jgi:hypothetical protein